jgi:hypothetical protein
MKVLNETFTFGLNGSLLSDILKAQELWIYF